MEQNVLPVKKDHPHPMEEGSVDWLSFDMRGPSLNTKNLANVWLIDGNFPWVNFSKVDGTCKARNFYTRKWV